MSARPRAAQGVLGFADEYAAAAERFADAVADTDLRSPVPACPDWSAYELVVHLGNVHAWAATIVETGGPADTGEDEPPSRRRRAVAEWYAGKAEDLYQVLRSADAGAPCWNFAFGTGVAGFWPRRQLHETQVHLVDLDQAGGRTTLLPPSLCADGVAEVLTVFLHRMHTRGYPAELSGPLSLVCTDTGHEWTLAPAADGPPAVELGGASSVDRVEAPAQVLLLLLWRRVRVDHPDVAVRGDESRVRAFLGSRLTP